jgi:osmotically-inducible protein OsmY
MRRTSSYVQRTDDELEEAVRSAFLYDPRVSVYGPNVSVSSGTVTLTGVVDNLKAKKAAERDARNVIGVWRVRNHLKVRPETVPSNEELKERVATAFREDPYLDCWEIGIEAHDGWVYLTGYVSTSWEKMHAEREARGVKGAIFVVNNLDYEHEWTWKSDWLIRSDTEDHLFWSPFVDEEDIDIQVADGIVTLKGTVETWAERNAAERNAYEAGAKDVINELTVTYRYDGPEFPYWYGPYYFY